MFKPNVMLIFSSSLHRSKILYLIEKISWKIDEKLTILWGWFHRNQIFSDSKVVAQKENVKISNDFRIQSPETENGEPEWEK